MHMRPSRQSAQFVDQVRRGKKASSSNHFELADLPEADRFLPDGGAATGGAGASSGEPRLSKFITTLPSNRTTSPLLRIRSLSEVSVPFSNLTSTCSS